MIRPGSEYRIRYRAQNFNGWGEFSDVAYILAATVPDRPMAPIYISSTSNSVTLVFVPPSNNGGSIITGYKLFYDSIQAIANYRLIYSGSNISATVTTADGLVTGMTYRFVLKVFNQFGDSDQSEEIRLALGQLPLKPASPFKNEE